MRRTVTIAVAITMLVTAAAAYAALNTYTASYAFSGRAGSPKAPASVGYKVNYTAANVTSGYRAAPLIKIVSKVYGLSNNGQDFPKCSIATIDRSPKFNGNCPRGSLVASGRVDSLLGGTNLSTSTAAGGSAGSPCRPYLDVYNGGKNVQYFFFFVKTGTDCAGLKTGASAPWTGTISQQGKYSVESIPLPPDISTKAGNLNGVFGSLITESVTYGNLTKRVRGKTVPYNASIGCLHGKRPTSTTFTATNGAGTTESRTVNYTANC